ncbi:MAG TPA: glycosyltransferase family 4 protein [Burkholderiales bacterium]|nr:glycosyltransferase family 4 protein [Burkholderiales bacterium]
MRIALVRQRYNPHGGAERFIERVLGAFPGGGATFSVFARRWTGARPGVEIVRCDPFYLGRVWRDAGFERAVCRALAARRFDLVQSHERVACCDIFRAGDGVHAQWLDNRRRALGPLGRLGIACNPAHRYALAAERRLFASPRLRAVICNSRMVRDEIRSRFGVAEDKLHVIYNGVDLEAFHPRLRESLGARARAELGIPPGAMTWVFVGSGFERKGVSRLVRAFREGAAAGAHLIVVGSDRRESRARAEARDLGERVHFLGGRDDVRPWYGAADAFVLPTLYDPFPNAALEAMACGLPVVTTHQCGAAELVRPGENGWLCDALDAASLASFMGALDPERARAMGARARATAEAHGLDATAARLLALYRALAPG